MKTILMLIAAMALMTACQGTGGAGAASELRAAPTTGTPSNGGGGSSSPAPDTAPHNYHMRIVQTVAGSNPFYVKQICNNFQASINQQIYNTNLNLSAGTFGLGRNACSNIYYEITNQGTQVILAILASDSVDLSDTAMALPSYEILPGQTYVFQYGQGY